MRDTKVKNMVLSAMFISIGMVLPFITGQLRQIGHMLLPMHIPVMLCGLICGWRYGLITGLVLPVMRSVIFSSPVMYPNAIAMSFELAVYGFTVGFLYSHSKRKSVVSLYICMIISMLSGRVVWGAAQMIMLGIEGKGLTYQAFLTRAFVNAIPGIILQLIVIPSIMIALKRMRGISAEYKNKIVY